MLYFIAAIKIYATAISRKKLFVKAERKIISADSKKLKKIEIFLKILSPFSKKSSSRMIFKIPPPSVEAIGIAVAVPIIKFIHAKTGFSIKKKTAANIKFAVNPAMSTAIFFSVLKLSGRNISIPKADNFISFAFVFTHNNAKKCPISCKAENKKATGAMPFLSAIKNIVSTAKNIGDNFILVLSTRNSTKSQSTPLGLYFFLQ